MDNFDLRNFLIENKLTTNSNLLSEDINEGLLGKGLLAGLLMSLGVYGQNQPKTTADYQKSIDSIKLIKPTTPEQRQNQRKALELLVQAKNNLRLAPIEAAQKKRIDNWIAANPGKDEKDYWAWQADREKGPDAGLDGLEIGKCNKRGKDKGSCSTGRTYKGGSLRDIN